MSQSCQVRLRITHSRGQTTKNSQRSSSSNNNNKHQRPVATAPWRGDSKHSLTRCCSHLDSVRLTSSVTCILHFYIACRTVEKHSRERIPSTAAKQFHIAALSTLGPRKNSPSTIWVTVQNCVALRQAVLWECIKWGSKIDSLGQNLP